MAYVTQCVPGYYLFNDELFNFDYILNPRVKFTGGLLLTSVLAYKCKL